MTSDAYEDDAYDKKVEVAGCWKKEGYRASPNILGEKTTIIM